MSKTKLRLYVENLLRKIIIAEGQVYSPETSHFKVSVLSQLYYSNDLVNKTFDEYLKDSSIKVNYLEDKTLYNYLKYLDTLSLADIILLETNITNHELLILFDNVKE